MSAENELSRLDKGRAAFGLFLGLFLVGWIVGSFVPRTLREMRAPDGALTARVVGSHSLCGCKFPIRLQIYRGSSLALQCPIDQPGLWHEVPTEAYQIKWLSDRAVEVAGRDAEAGVQTRVELSGEDISVKRSAPKSAGT